VGVLQTVQLVSRNSGVTGLGGATQLGASISIGAGT